MVSIIIPAYNAEFFIEKTITSVLNQTYINWELIIINDGSTDSTIEKVNPFLSDKIVLYSQVNKGVSAARNFGLTKSKGEYIAFLDADDYWLPENLDLKINLLIKSNADFVFSNFIKCDINLNHIENGSVGTDTDMLHKLLLWEQDVIPGASSNLVLKKICFEKGLTFDTKFSTAADQDFCFYLTKSYKGQHLNSFTWLYRVYNTSMSKNVLILTKDHVGVYKKAKKENLFQSFLFKNKCFSNMYLIMAGNWWVNADNKLNAIKYIFLSLMYNPFNFVKLLKKITH